eukprot:TRINITY_DN8159_c0_g1_i3.p1 TRINITY_DN8159_c0_g1~~TRINITY_DN8159_c0_g1_i3.p1  ORF type:complete len:304 (-),score=53.33 TRINITY_DN8159_c0_g1_i3:210-1121(-)
MFLVSQSSQDENPLHSILQGSSLRDKDIKEVFYMGDHDKNGTINFEESVLFFKWVDGALRGVRETLSFLHGYSLETLKPPPKLGSSHQITLHEHELLRVPNKSGWKCAGIQSFGRCKSGKKDSKDLIWYICDECSFAICHYCVLYLLSDNDERIPLLRQIFDEIDKNKDQGISYSEFCSYIISTSTGDRKTILGTILKDLDNKIPTQNLVKDPRHGHKLNLKSCKIPFVCSGCKEKGEGWVYSCDVDGCGSFRLHPGCLKNRDQLSRHSRVAQLSNVLDQIGSFALEMGFSQEEVNEARRGSK